MITITIRRKKLATHRQHDAEPGFAAHHPVVSLSNSFQRINFVHGSDATQDAEFESILRISRRAGIPAFDPTLSADQKQG